MPQRVLSMHKILGSVPSPHMNSTHTYTFWIPTMKVLTPAGRQRKTSNEGFHTQYAPIILSVIANKRIKSSLTSR